MRPFLIGIGGCSGSGKSTLASALAARIEYACLLALDSYYHPLDHLRPEDRVQVNFDHPDALDWELLFTQLKALRSGNPIEEPVYLFDLHTRGAATRRRRAGECVIVEGILALHEKRVRGLLDLMVFVEAPEGLCLRRRITRDTRERGRTEASVLAQYASTVRPMAERFVLPTKSWAQIVVDGAAPVDLGMEEVLRAYREGTSSPASPNL